MSVDRGGQRLDEHGVGRDTVKTPFLFTNVPAGQDFTATVKMYIANEWSMVGGGTDRPGGKFSHAPWHWRQINTDENFVTSTTFRTDAANVNEGNTLQKRIEAGRK